MLKTLYIVTHEFRNGQEDYPFFSETNNPLLLEDNEVKLAEILGIPFDCMGRDEYLIIRGPFDMDDIPTI